MSNISEVNDLLSTRFAMKDLGSLSCFLGVAIIQTGNGIALSQKQYVMDMLSDIGITDYKPRSLPCVSDRYSLLDDSFLLNLGPLKLLSISTVGLMYYLLNCTRLDISIALNLLSRHMQSPNESALQCAKILLRYLQGTADFGLALQQN
jgi:hypothetical protein